MTVILLIRHGRHNYGDDRIAGRQPEVLLSEEGKRQVDALADRLGAIPMKALYTSPLERTRETAERLASHLGLTPRISPEIIEIDFGDWEGQKFDDLQRLEAWKHFNSFRSGARAPNGELMIEAQVRIVTFIENLSRRHPNETIALVSHGDVIKAALLYYLGAPLDFFHRIEIDLASVSVVAVADYGPKVFGMNHTGTLPALPKHR